MKTEDSDREHGPRYAAELDQCAELLQKIHPIGKVKAIGRLEVVAALTDVLAMLAKEGPLNAERWTLDDLLDRLTQWKAVASGRTCVSFESLCFGASSLWHQTHRENFRAVDRKPEDLSRWVLEHSGCVMADFPKQVLEILIKLQEENAKLKE